METVAVKIEDKNYNVYIGSNIISMLPKLICDVRRPTKVVVLTNRVLADKYGTPVKNILNDAGIESELIVIRAGESNKNIGTVSRIYEMMAEMHLDRSSAIIGVGGGVVCDIAGFVGATYMRGIDVYQVPTTLVAQVDAAVGGKTGVDLPQGKNLVGAFYQPKAVIADSAVLRTLPARDVRCGLAEVVKHGIIKDENYFKYVRSRASYLTGRNEEEMQKIVRRSVEIKAEVVEQDEREGGIRAILNYGHTVAHALEVVTEYKGYRHGEAVAVGMVTEAILAESIGVCNTGISGEIVNILVGLRLPVEIGEEISAEALLEAMIHDKKAVNGELKFALPTGIGSCKIVPAVSKESVLEAIQKHQKLDVHSAWM